MDEKRLSQEIQKLGLGPLRYFPSLDSTNSEAARWAVDGAGDGSLVLADAQTAGRGRLGRQWYTAPDSALAFTLILRPSQVGEFTLYAGLGALAVCSALRQEYGLSAEIKWPNDVLLVGKKVAGVLVEARWEGSELDSLLVGIGVNVGRDALPPASWSAPALFPSTAVELFLEAPLAREDLLLAILARLVEWRARLGRPEFLQAWQEHLAWQGEWVRILGMDGSIACQGRLMHLAEDGALILQDAEGIPQVVRAGDVRLRPG